MNMRERLRRLSIEELTELYSLVVGEVRRRAAARSDQSGTMPAPVNGRCRVCRNVVRLIDGENICQECDDATCDLCVDVDLSADMPTM